MPPPTVLKRKHCLKGKNILPLIRKMREGPMPLQMARFRMNVPMESMEEDEIINQFRELTGESEKEILEMAGKAVTSENLKALAHHAIVHANEFGQPEGQELHSGEKEHEEPPKKRQKTELEKRIDELEKMQKTEDNKELEEAKFKVRSLAMQANPSVPLLLMSLDELARVARKCGSEDTQLFEELARQANYNSEKIDVSDFCLKVMGGKATDLVGKALSKAIKKLKDPEQPDFQQQKAKEHQPQSPLVNMYPQAQGYYGYMVPPYFPQPHGYGYGQGSRRYRGGMRGQQNGRGVCLFCSSPDHFVRDCEKMKAAKGK